MTLGRVADQQAPTAPIVHPDQLTPTWLSAAIGAEVTAVTANAVGTGQMGTCFQIALQGSDGLPATVLAKLPAEDQTTRTFLHGSYGTEVRFYRELLGTVHVKAPKPYYAEISDEPSQRGTFTLILEDLWPARQGDQIAGCTPAQARSAVENAAGLHAPRWCDPSLLDVEGLARASVDDQAIMDSLFPEAVEIALSRLGDAVSSDDSATLRAVSNYGGRWLLGRSDVFGLVHGDYRLDNLMFHPDGRLWAVDWQTLALGLPMRDVALMVSSGLSITDRRRHESRLLEAYRQRLLALGVLEYSAARCWDDYRYALVQAPLISVFGCAYSSVRTERGDAMFSTMIARGCQAIRDLDTLALLRELS